MEEVPAAVAEIAEGAKRTAVPADGRHSVSATFGSAVPPPGSPIALRGLAVRPPAPPSPHERPVPGGHLHTLRRMAGATVEPSPRSQHASAHQVPADAADGGGPSADARVRASAKAYSAPLADTPELFRLWCRASKDGKNTYRTSRRNFWNLVNNDTGSDAEWARQMFADAQVEVQVGTAKAPMLRMRTGDRNAGREGTDRRITLDHIDPQSTNATRASDAANLHFDTQRDNSFRGAKPLQATASVRPPATAPSETSSGTATNLPPPTASVKSTDSPRVERESTALGEGESPRKLVEAPDVQDGIGSGPVAVAAGTPG